jgi:hypothetical protein
VATDNAGNRQPTPASAQATTTVDATPPTSTVAALSAFNGSSFTVTWSGSDNPGGSGLTAYDVYVSDNGGSFTPLLTNTTLTSRPFTGVDGHSYGFYSVATDQVGNRQPTPGAAQARTTVDAVAPASSVAALSPYGTPTFSVSWSGSDNPGGSGLASFTVSVSDNGGPFAPWLVNTTQTSASYPGVGGHTYGFYSIATDLAGNRQPAPAGAQATTQIDITPPTSAVTPLPAYTATASFPVSWAGSDEPGGSGVAGFDIFVRDNGAAPTPWLVGTTQTSATFPGAFGHSYSFTSIATDRAGNRQPAAGAPAQTLLTPGDNVLFVSGLYHDLLGRAADPAGLASRVGQVDAGRERALKTVSTAFVTSTENRSNLVKGFYQMFLNRQPDATELNSWLTRLAGTYTPEQVRGVFASSLEYFQRQGSANAAWLDRMYLDLLGRARDPGSQSFLDGLNRGRLTREQVVAQIQDSTEYRNRLVNQVFQTYLGRQAGTTDLNIWRPAVVGPKSAAGVPAPSEAFVAAVLASREYVQKNGNTSEFVIATYYTRVLARPADAAGLASHLTRAIDGYAAERQAAALVLDRSDEYRNQLVTAFFQQYLGRSPSPTDLTRWRQALQQGQTDEQVQAALLGSGEYFQRAGGTNAKFLDRLYQDVLGRPRQPTETSFLNALNGGTTRQQVAASILGNGEYRRRLVGIYFSGYLRRAARPDELDLWAGRLGSGNSDEQVLASVLSMSEYFRAAHLHP